MRRCKARLLKNGKAYDVCGIFHQWGSAYHEFETGPGNFTTAIIELDDGKVVEADVGSVQFLDADPSSHLAEENTALTLEELREMDGEPVWCEDNTIEAGIIRMAEDWSTEQMEAHIWTFDVEGNAMCKNVRLMLEFGAKFYHRLPGREDRLGFI